LLFMAALAFSLCGGCVSIRMEKPVASPGMYGAGFLEVRVFESMSALRKEEPTKRQILCELYVTHQAPPLELVHRSTEPVWALSNLPDGRYRLQVVGLVDEKGELHSLGSTDQVDFDISAGAGVRMSVILSSGQGLAENVGKGALVLGLMVACASLDEHGVNCSWP
jgi:microcompartment protein CcmK/EutM